MYMRDTQEESEASHRIEKSIMDNERVLLMDNKVKQEKLRYEEQMGVLASDWDQHNYCSLKREIILERGNISGLLKRSGIIQKRQLYKKKK